MLISQEIKLDFDDVLIVPQRTTLESRKEVVLERNFKFYHSPRVWSGIPIVCSNMVPLTSKSMAIKLSQFKMITALHKYYSCDELLSIINEAGIDYAWVSIGKSYDDIEKLKSLTEKLGASPNIIIDVPNGYMESFVKFCAQARQQFPDSIICAGNVTTPEICEELIIHGGVDICKIQIGPGQFCETRMVTGVGYGTFSCINECGHATHGLKTDTGRLGLIMSDGGCRTSGDVCKGMCGGSDFIMLGSIFAGTEECEGEWEYEYKCSDKKVFDPDKQEAIARHHWWQPIYPGYETEKRKTFLTFYGMSSHLAQEKHGEGKKDYRASEGKVEKVAYKGPVENIIREILGGLRSCGTYIGAKYLKDFNKCAKFVKINRK
jgi:GMP reductase